MDEDGIGIGRAVDRNVGEDDLGVGAAGVGGTANGLGAAGVTGVRMECGVDLALARPGLPRGVDARGSAEGTALLEIKATLLLISKQCIQTDLIKENHARMRLGLSPVGSGCEVLRL